MIHAVRYWKLLHRNKFISHFSVTSPSNHGMHCKRAVERYSPKHRHLNPGIFTLWRSHVGEPASLACRGDSSTRSLHVTINDSSVGSRLAAADSPSETGQAALEVSQTGSDKRQNQQHRNFKAPRPIDPSPVPSITTPKEHFPSNFASHHLSQHSRTINIPLLCLYRVLRGPKPVAKCRQGGYRPLPGPTSQRAIWVLYARKRSAEVVKVVSSMFATSVHQTSHLRYVPLRC